jgi:hypothetical protein
MQGGGDDLHQQGTTEGGEWHSGREPPAGIVFLVIVGAHSSPSKRTKSPRAGYNALQREAKRTSTSIAIGVAGVDLLVE